MQRQSIHEIKFTTNHEKIAPRYFCAIRYPCLRPIPLCYTHTFMLQDYSIHTHTFMLHTHTFMLYTPTSIPYVTYPLLSHYITYGLPPFLHSLIPTCS